MTQEKKDADELFSSPNWQYHVNSLTHIDDYLKNGILSGR
jgi:hypothetical protein